ncbi:interleukin-18 receptor 1 isoform X2 [Sceloporus undulatus]|uniref:interleukin-18 receptor 1 isoform X2 n=1 Tax=Sceloporus undulatus TaxID=8520 RepID=UPI001C4BBEAB|nr:interleukin-18 receptor 1 isoform X2 [Sceloporus undulatus]
MCFEKLTIVILVILGVVRPGKLCKRRSPIYVLETEYFSNCCPAAEENKGYTVTWHREQEGKSTAIQEDRRINMNGTYLQFWPVVLNDTGNYTCCLSNGTDAPTCYQWSLKVIQKIKESCFNEDHLLTVIPGIVGKSYPFACSDIPHPATTVSITWYKNCSRIENQIEEQWHIEQLKADDNGKYTCVKSLVHEGRRYNITHTVELIVNGDKEITGPALIGSDHSISKTEIGKEVLLNCTAFLGYSSNSDQFTFSWSRNYDLIELCEDAEEEGSLCQMKENIYYENGRKYVSKQLWIKSVEEADMNSSYICTLSFNGRKPVRQIHTLQKDGKLYDAFVSYLKDSGPIYGEERKFALEILPQTLEDHFGYKLCIFERDICPGGAITDDVQSFTERSRRLIIILSRNYVSDKVMLELETGLHKALVERKIKVILIEYMPATDFDFLPKSLQLLSSSQVVKWEKDKSLPLNSRFWKKLRYAMPAKPTWRKNTNCFVRAESCQHST